MKICFIDLETTGLNPETDRITELSATVRINGRVRGSLNLKHKSDATYYSSFSDFVEQYVDKFDPEDKMLFAGWKADFDMSFIRALYRKQGDDFFGSIFWNPCYDIMQLALHKLREKRHKIENFKLGTVAKFLKISVVQKNLHSAKYDNDLCRKIYNKIV